ncbi:MAG: nucleotide exchange factor GrpE [Deltaproteobacteria bacterium]|nr:MAG: nucleotide exchange factor GrpE [Deltaproteobacteria bacterium]
MSDETLKAETPHPEGSHTEGEAGDGAETRQGPAETPPAGRSGPEKAVFEMDPALVEAMKEAESAVERRQKAKGEEAVEVEVAGDDPPGGPAIPTGGAGEGTVRALAEMRKALDALEASEAKVAALEEQLKRTAADFDNFRKRVAREREEDRKFAIEKLLKELLPVIDNMERALESASAEAGEVESQLLTGVKMVHKLFLDTLKKFGVEQFSAKGEPFNPEKHEAMQTVESAEVPEGHVAEEYMKGYYLNERLVRPAMVAVAKAPAGALPGQAPGSDGAKAEPAGGEHGGATGTTPEEGHGGGAVSAPSAESGGTQGES